MKKLLMVLMLGMTLYSCTLGVRKQVVACVQSAYLGNMFCGVAIRASEPDPRRASREPVLLLRILTER